MHYRMRDNLSWCASNGQAVFLDLASDRYFRLRPEDDQKFQSWAATGETSGFDPGDLIRAGVLVQCDRQQPPRAKTETTMPAIEFGEEAGPPPRLVDIVRALAAQRRAARDLGRGKLAFLIEAVKADGAPRSGADSEAAARRIAAVFASTPLSFRKADRCLPRALAAQAMCRKLGVRPTVVFGVRLQPFAAHCWLQLGPHVIVGDLEQARMFVPILAVP